MRASWLPLALAALALACGRGDRRPLMVIITPPHDNVFFKAEGEAAAARARELGYAVLLASHDDDLARQDRLVDTAIARGAAAIILDNAGAAASATALRRARAAGIPAFLMDREITASGIAVAQIVAAAHEGASAGAREFATRLGGRGDYVELVGKESDTNAQIRSRAYGEVLAGYPELRRVARVTANWSQAEAFQKIETVLQRHRDIRGVIAGNDTMALGAIAALRAAGVRDVVVVGFDGSPDALAAIRRGEMHATVLQPAARMAQMAVEQAHAYLGGARPGAERQAVPCELVTAGNVDQFGLFARLP